MTTIAYRDGILAADTLITSNGNADGHAVKIVRVGDMLVGASGHTVYCQKFLAWMQDGEQGDCPLTGLKDDDKVNGMSVMSDGVIRMWCSAGEWHQKPAHGFYSLGSGCEYAMGAMACGMTAAAAIQIAARFDAMTGGEVTVITR